MLMVRRATDPAGGGGRLTATIPRPATEGGDVGGISLGGIIVILGIVLMFVWSFWWGLIIALIGLLAFGGFARGRWY